MAIANKPHNKIDRLPGRIEINRIRLTIEQAAKDKNRPVSMNEHGEFVFDRRDAAFTIAYVGRETYIADHYSDPIHMQPSCTGSLHDVLQFVAGRVLFDI